MMLVSFLAIGALFLAPTSGAAFAGQSKVKKGSATPVGFADVRTALDRIWRDYDQALKDQAGERPAGIAFQGHDKRPGFREQILQFAQEPSTDAAMAAKAVVFVYIASLREPTLRIQARDLLFDRHLDSDYAVVAMPCLYEGTETVSWFSKAHRQSKNRSVRGVAAYELARRLHASERSATPGSKKAEKSKDSVDRERRIKTLLEELNSNYADVRWAGEKIGDLARNMLFEIERLAVGCVAPEIEGEDSDGRRFKLSDYRGKVVVIDFWGHW